MKNLFIIRHAKAGWKDGRSDDFHRPLKEEGVDQALAQANLLKRLKVKPDLIISSPAFRAINTAITFSEVLNYPFGKIQLDKRIYEADTEILLDVIHELENQYTHALLFGHNMGLSYLASYFNNGKELIIPVCGIVQVTFEAQNWSNCSSSSVSDLKHFF